MTTTLDVDLCVIGAGAAGLSVTAGAAQLGLNVVLVEKGLMGGDCLNYGCVPSKALLSAGKAAYHARHAGHLGVRATPTVDFGAAMDHVHRAIANITPMDTVARYEGFGAKVLQGTARFVDADTVVVDDLDTRIRAHRFVVATGSRPLVPPIDGLADVPYLTNETVFENRECPRHLVVIGAGPIGLEMAQAHRRLGAEVTVVEAVRAFGKDDPECAEIVLKQLRGEGIRLLIGAKAKKAVRGGQGVLLTVEQGGAEETLDASHVLVAAGRTPVLDTLDLDAAGVKHTKQGIAVDAGLRTGNGRIYAVGDVAGGPQFTHVAGYHAGIVIQRALFKIPAKVSTAAVPWVTYTDPELAHVGMTEDMAREAHGEIRILRWPLAENDRAQAEGLTDGIVKAIVTPKGRILGATIVAPGAGDLIQPWILAIASKLKIRAMTGYMAPYPTLGEMSKRAAGTFYAASLFSPRTRKIAKFMFRLG